MSAVPQVQDQRPGRPRQETDRAATDETPERNSTMSNHINGPTATDHTDLDRLDRLADSLWQHKSPFPRAKDDLDAADLAEVEELAHRFNVLPPTILHAAELLGDESEDFTDVHRFFDSARHDAQLIGLRLPQDQAPAKETSAFPRYNLVYSDATLTTVSHLIATDGPGAGFYLVTDPATVEAVAAQFGEVTS